MFSEEITKARYCLPGEDSWDEVTNRCMQIWDIVDAPKRLREPFKYYMNNKKFIPGGRILRNTGLPVHQVANCFLFSVEDSREGWGEIAQKATVTLMTGGGVGVDYGALRSKGRVLKSSLGVSSGPIPLIKSINEIGRGVQCGGFRRSALYASLPWYHEDIFDFIHMKDWPSWLKEQKALDMEVAAPSDMTNISVRLDKAFFSAYTDGSHGKHEWAVRVFNDVVTNMCLNGEPGFQVDFDHQILRNACTEIISADDSDSCVLGALNFARLRGDELEEATAVGAAFLLAVTEYNQSPTKKAHLVQQKNRRLGLGVMGVGEWFLNRGLPYGSQEIMPWFDLYKRASISSANENAARWGFPIPIAIRAIAPTGTISIVAETTSGIEPLFAPAYERRYLTKQGFAIEVLVDPVAARVYETGVKNIEYAHIIDPERRIKFQADVQKYVDNAISSTVNLPDMSTDSGVFGSTLSKYLPLLRGITAFPNGSRGLQPITPISIDDAIKRGYKYEHQDTACPSGVCSI